MAKLVRITTVPLSLEKLLEGQLNFMSRHYTVTAISADKRRLELYGRENRVNTYHVEMTREITPVKDFRALWRLLRYFQKEKPEIVHTHTPKAGILGMLAAKVTGVPIRLHTVAGLPLLESRGMKRLLLETVERLTYRCATKIFSNSSGLKTIILRGNFTSPQKVQVLGEGSSNGIDTHFFDPARISLQKKQLIMSDFEIPSEDFKFLFVGRIVADKGINELIQAFVRLQKKRAKTSLILVGPFEQELDPLHADTLHLIYNHPKIFSTGFQSDVRPFFAISHVLVFPSYREGFPNVVMQAGAMGLPSIVSDINGCNEIIQDGLNGLIVPPKDIEGLLNAMEFLSSKDQHRTKMQYFARPIICKKYERREFWQILLREYKKLESEYLK